MPFGFRNRRSITALWCAVLIYCDPTAHHYGGPSRSRTYGVSSVVELQSTAIATMLPTHIIGVTYPIDSGLTSTLCPTVYSSLYTNAAGYPGRPKNVLPFGNFTFFVATLTTAGDGCWIRTSGGSPLGCLANNWIKPSLPNRHFYMVGIKLSSSKPSS